MQLQSKNVAECGVLTALALILSYVESLIPFCFGVPGMKLGLTNIVIVFALYSLPWQETMMINIMRILLAGFLFGNFYSIAYSLAGGILSFCIMMLLKHTEKFSCMGVSVGGGISHNAWQLIVACIAVKNYNVALYMPALTAAGAVTGALIGVTSIQILRLMKRSSI